MIGEDRRVGLTTTVPVEAIFAAGLVPVDLNNLFIAGGRPLEMIEEAERAGLPRTSCAWVKGVYAACRAAGIRRLVGVLHGDCSGTQAILELLADEGVAVIPFAYPVERQARLVAEAVTRLARELGTTVAAAEEWRERLAPVRARLGELDATVAPSGRLASREAHEWMVSASDFRGDPAAFAAGLDALLAEASRRRAPERFIRLGLAGVPPIAADFFEFVDGLGARVVYNEIPMEFTQALQRGEPLDRMYAAYSYPYDSRYRLERIRAVLGPRRPAGVIHYLQSFCHRQITARLLRQALGRPVLELECDRPGPLDGPARTRIESFVEMLRARGDAP
jgi:benzoyl-CoA reductase/2-hydroxyglutaryl-CoA dehydratase subunit BcrC/BadD/HgdB